MAVPATATGNRASRGRPDSRPPRAGGLKGTGAGADSARVSSVRDPLGRESGFTLLEVMVACFVLVVGVLGAVALIDGANATTVKTKSREQATGLGRNVLEAARAVPYEALTAATIEANLQAQPGLGDDSPSAGWQVRRRETLFTVTATACSYDDPTDGVGARTAGGFCADAPAGGTLDKNPDDYRRATVTLSWPSGGRTITASQTTIVNHPGGAAGPRVESLTMTSPSGGLPITGDADGSTANATNANFSLTTSVVAASINWYVDGVVQGQVGGSGLTRTFTWPLGANPSWLDGPYTVSAQGFDQFGVSRGAKSLGVVVDRRRPYAPKEPDGTRNGAVIDMGWLPYGDRDVTGYVVQRTWGAQGFVASCNPTKTTTCSDGDDEVLPALPSGQSYGYRVWALDARGAYGPGDAVTFPIQSGAKRPNPPRNLAATSAGSTTTLTWQPPARVPKPIAFYRVYRDGRAVANRYAEAPATTFTDDSTGGRSHTYYVTTVDIDYGESLLAGPVTR